ncbi:MAG: hypothetical protein Q4F56_00405 [Candidatus Saccharibacteria bacterium]|nr:hypothetical protein [Candidatus Saccharibacteria bacterium]
MDDGQKGDTNNSWWHENKKLFLVLCGFCVVIVGLVVGIAIVNTNNEDTTEFSDEEVDCTSLSDSFDMRQCIALRFEDGQESQASEMYSSSKDMAYAAGEHELFVRLINDEASHLLDADNCEQAMRVMDDDRIDSIETAYKIYHYELAISIAMECENNEAVATYNDKMDYVIETEGYGDEDEDGGLLGE